MVCIGVLFFFFIQSNTVHANSNQLHELHYDVELLENGSGRIVETRVMTIEEGTENFMGHQGLTEEDISNFEVYANGEPLAWQPDWDSDLSQEAKALEYGILEISDGVEFVWGIPEYGEVTYELHYTIDNMVWQLEDGQSMNWAFFRGDGSLTPEQMSLKVEAPEDLTGENTTLALLGLEGAEWELSNGIFHSEKTEELSANEDIILLLQFEEEMFAGLEYLDQTLEEQAEEALEGSSYEDFEEEIDEGVSTPISRPETEWRPPFIFRILPFVFPLVMFVFPLFVFGILFLPKMKEGMKKSRGHMATVDERIERNRPIHSNEIPYSGNISEIAFLLNEIDAGRFEDYFFAFLLKWAKEKRIEIIPQEVGVFKKRKEMVIQLVGSPTAESSEIEKDFWDMLEEAADRDGVIEEGDLSKWAQRNHRTLSQLEENLMEDSKEFLISQGYLTERIEKGLVFFSIPIVEMTTNGEALFDKILQYDNFLENVSDVKVAKEEMEQIKDWDQFMIWSCLLGYGEDIVEKLQNHFPEVWADTVYIHPYYGWHGHMYGYRTQFRQGYSRGQSSSSSSGSFSSGSSGGSFGGGGGGSMGGGSSGVR